MQEKNLINLIKKIKDINFEYLENYIFKKFLLFTLLPIFSIIFLASIFLINNLNSEYYIDFYIFSLIFCLIFSFLSSIFFIHLSLKNKYILSYLQEKFIISSITKKLKIKLNKDEINTLINLNDDQNNILILLLKEQIKNLNTENFYHFLNLYKDIKLTVENFQELTLLLFNNIVKENKLIDVFYSNKYNKLSEKELILHNFLKYNNDFLMKIIPIFKDSIYKENSFSEIIVINNFTKILTTEKILSKALESYSLQEITESLFLANTNSNLNKLLNYLDIEQLMFLKKNVIEKVLEEKDERVIINCQEEFFKYAFKLDLKNKDLLCLMEDKCSILNKVVIKESLNIIHI